MWYGRLLSGYHFFLEVYSRPMPCDFRREIAEGSTLTSEQKLSELLLDLQNTSSDIELTYSPEFPPSGAWIP